MSEVRNAAVKSITAAMETEVGRKIIVSKMLAITEDNRILKRKVAEDRIAVHALNELTNRLIHILYSVRDHCQSSGMEIDEKTRRLVNSAELYRKEAFGAEMTVRLDGILNDDTGDDLLLEDLVGKQPKETQA